MTTASDTEYVVMSTQINRYNPVTKEQSVLTRGETFKASDVEPAELDRWLKIKPAPVVTSEDYAKRLEATPAGAAARIAQLEAELAALKADDEPGADGDDDAVDADGDGKLDVPADNASVKAWRSYASALPDLDDEARAWIAANDRDAIRGKYKPAA